MNRLKELRKEKGDTQEVVAKAMGVTRRGYQKAQQLADYFKVSVGYLLGYEDLLDQIEEVDSELSKGMTIAKNLSVTASSSYEELFRNILILLKGLKEVAEVTQVDSSTLIEVVENLEEHMKDLDDSIRKMVSAQIKYIELQNLKKKLNRYKG